MKLIANPKRLTTPKQQTELLPANQTYDNRFVYENTIQEIDHA
jgi:SOS-response transcriptional repressor LexA